MMAKLNKNLVLAAVVGAALAAPSAAFATNGYFAHGYGTKTKGLAGAATALSQDSLAAATNPAGMVMVGNRLDIGAAVFSPDPRSYATEGGSPLADGAACGFACPFTIGGQAGSQSIESGNTGFVIPHIGYNKMLDDNSSIGVSVYGNGGMNTNYRGGVAQHANQVGVLETNAGTYGAGTAGVDLSQLFVATTYARKYNDKGSWGASFILAYQRFEAKGLANFAGLSVDTTSLTDNGLDDSTGFGVKFGVQHEVAPGLTLAGAYQSEMFMSEFDDYAGLYANEGEFNIPSSINLGLAWDINANSVLVFDIQHIAYEDIDAISNPIANLVNNCTPGPGGPTGSGCLGASDGGGFGWENMTVYKLGYQMSTGNDMVWRAGISYGEQPIPDEEVLFNVLAPGVMETHLTAGMTKKLANGELNLALMYAPENSVKGNSAFNPGQTIELEMQQYEIELSYGMKF